MLSPLPAPSETAVRSLRGREILDSRGVPTVEAEVVPVCGAVPAEHQKERAKFAKTTSNEFEAQDRRPDPEQVALVVGKITAIRAEIAGMRAE